MTIPDVPFRQLDAAAVLRHLNLLGVLDPAATLVYAYPDRADAETSARKNRDDHGHDVWPLMETEAGWVEIIDLRPALARLQQR